MRVSRKLVARASVIVILTMAAIAGISSRPQKVEGLYTAGKLITCMCDCSHYLRFHDGFVIHYATNHEPAELLGQYEVNTDGSVVVHMSPLRLNEPEVFLFTIDQPRAGFAFARTDDGESSFLRRVNITGDVADLLSKQEVRSALIPDDTKLVTTFYDSSLTVLREEVKPLKKSKAEQGGGGQPDTR